MLEDYSSQQLSQNICERCHNQQATFYCPVCMPFHNFCQRCDAVVHSMKIKSGHVRENLLGGRHQHISNLNATSNNIKPTISDYNSMPSDMRRCSLTPQPNRQKIDYFQESPKFQKKKTTYNDNNLYSYRVNSQPNDLSNTMPQFPPVLNHSPTFGNNVFQLNPAGQPLGYTKEYVCELRRINEKEKQQMQFKIDALETQLDRLKETLQCEMKKMENDLNESFKNLKIAEKNYANNLENLSKEKDEQIECLASENDLLKEKNTILQESLQKRESENAELSNKVANLKDEITSLRNDNEYLHKNHIDKMQELEKIKINEINNLNETYRKQINELFADGKNKNDKLVLQVKNDGNTIDVLYKNNNNLTKLVHSLEHSNHVLIHNNQEFKKEINQLTVDLENSYILCKSLEKSLDICKSENTKLKSDYEFLQNTIMSLKNELVYIKEAKAKKEQDFNLLLEQSEKIRKSFSKHMFNNEELDSLNRSLVKENDNLKKTIESFKNIQNRTNLSQTYYGYNNSTDFATLNNIANNSMLISGNNDSGMKLSDNDVLPNNII